MKPARLCIEKDGVVVIPAIEVADGFLTRMIGLLGRRSLPAGTALWLTPATSIHTFFMRFDLDLVFLTRAGQVRRVARCVPPGRIVLGGGWSGSVLEMQSGWLPESALREGDQVQMAPA